MFVFTSSKKVTIKIYKPFFRCGDILYNNPENETLINYLEKFDIKLVLQSQVLFKEHHVTIFTKNYDLNHYTLGGGKKLFSFIEYLNILQNI